MSIESNLKDLQKYANDMGPLKACIDHEIFALSDFEKEIQQLEKNLNKAIQKLLDMHLEGYFGQNKYLNGEVDKTGQSQNISIPKIIEAEDQWIKETLMPLLKSSNSIFAFKKKRDQSVQLALLSLLESLVESIKERIIDEIQIQRHRSNDLLLSNIEEEFNERYLPYDKVKQVIPLIEEQLKPLDLKASTYTLKDMILSSKDEFTQNE